METHRSYVRTFVAVRHGANSVVTAAGIAEWIEGPIWHVINMYMYCEHI